MRLRRATLSLLLVFLLSTACLPTQAGTETAASKPVQEQPTATFPPTLVQDPPTATPVPTLSPGTYTNPVLNQDFPDPEVLRVGNTYYAFSTNSGKVNIQAARSTDLVHWQMLGDALPKLPSWAAQDFGYAWAPGVWKPAENSDYVMYFTARFAIGLGGIQCIGTGTSPAVMGPYVPTSSDPFVCQRDQGGSIDADVFVDEDGSKYFLWKSDNNSRGSASTIYIQPFSPDGLSLAGEPTSLIKADQLWEGIVVEGPVLWKQDGKYFLFYSANGFNSPNYAVGYAVASYPLGPYQKATSPLLKTDLNAGIVGPGGQDITLDAEGQTWLLFHTWTPAAIRALGLARLEWVDGKPEVRELSRAPMPAPATSP